MAHVSRRLPSAVPLPRLRWIGSLQLSPWSSITPRATMGYLTKATFENLRLRSWMSSESPSYPLPYHPCSPLSPGGPCIPCGPGRPDSHPSLVAVSEISGEPTIRISNVRVYSWLLIPFPFRLLHAASSTPKYTDVCFSRRLDMTPLCAMHLSKGMLRQAESPKETFWIGRHSCSHW